MPASSAAAFLREQQLKAPTRSGDWLYERYHWRLIYQGVLLAEKLTHSPFATDKRAGLEVCLWLLQSPFLNVYAHQMPVQAIESLVFPTLAAASDDTTALISRLHLLRLAVDIYDRTGYDFKAQQVLRAIIATADATPNHLNLADGARYQLAFRLKTAGQTQPALALLNAITHDSLRQGAQEVAALWRRDLR